ncbi:MAG: hypothetical protein ACPGRD_10775, partial [Planktomarina sp.]
GLVLASIFFVYLLLGNHVLGPVLIIIASVALTFLQNSPRISKLGLCVCFMCAIFLIVSIMYFTTSLVDDLGSGYSANGKVLMADGRYTPDGLTRALRAIILATFFYAIGETARLFVNRK